MTKFNPARPGRLAKYLSDYPAWRAGWVRAQGQGTSAGARFIAYHAWVKSRDNGQLAIAGNFAVENLLGIHRAPVVRLIAPIARDLTGEAA